jgi:hypothetical protein
MRNLGFAEPAGAGKGFRGVLGLVAGFALAVGMTAPVLASDGMGGAEKLRKLDIMLMVTSLRCRTTADSFSVEYGQFTTNHLAELNHASDALRASLAHRFGPVGSARALDRISTVMANTYGQGHPWMSCRDLKAATAELAQVRGRHTLLQAADDLLGEGGGAELAYARR